MHPSRFHVATFNLFNLALPETPFYGHRRYSKEEFARKEAWIQGQLKTLNADLVGFQEVFQAEALEGVVERSGLYPQARVVTVPRDEPLPTVGLVSRFPIREIEGIAEFPEEAEVDLEAGFSGVKRFSRPVLRAQVELPGEVPVDVYVIHLKSKRPVVPEGRDPHDPIERAKGKARALFQRAAEAVALRTILVRRMQGVSRPVIVLGDANDSRDSVSTEILSGTPPWAQMPRAVKEKIWDILLYDCHRLVDRKWNRDVTYSHIHNGRYETLDHIFVSQEFVRQYPRHIASVESISGLNDHLVDRTLSREPLPGHTSDHGQVKVTFRLRPPAPSRARP